MASITRDRSRRCTTTVARENDAALVPFLLKGVADIDDAARFFQADRCIPPQRPSSACWQRLAADLRKILQ